MKACEGVDCPIKDTCQLYMTYKKLNYFSKPTEIILPPYDKKSRKCSAYVLFRKPRS